MHGFKNNDLVLILINSNKFRYPDFRRQLICLCGSLKINLKTAAKENIPEYHFS